MTSIEFSDLGRQLFGRYGWQSELADKLGISRLSVWRYTHGKRTIPQPVAMAIRSLLVRDGK